MSTMTPTLMRTNRRPYRLSVEQYEQMVGEGIFPKRDRIELIEGQLVEKMTKNPPHSVTVGLCLDVLGAALPAGWHTRGEQPVRIPFRETRAASGRITGHHGGPFH